MHHRRKQLRFSKVKEDGTFTIDDMEVCFLPRGCAEFDKLWKERLRPSSRHLDFVVALDKCSLRAHRTVLMLASPLVEDEVKEDIAFYMPHVTVQECHNFLSVLYRQPFTIPYCQFKRMRSILQRYHVLLPKYNVRFMKAPRHIIPEVSAIPYKYVAFWHYWLNDPCQNIPSFEPAHSKSQQVALQQVDSQASSEGSGGIRQRTEQLNVPPRQVDSQASSEGSGGVRRRTEQLNAKLDMRFQEPSGAHSQATAMSSTVHSNTEVVKLPSTHSRNPLPQKTPLPLVNDRQTLPTSQGALPQRSQAHIEVTFEQLAYFYSQHASAPPQVDPQAPSEVSVGPRKRTQLLNAPLFRHLQDAASALSQATRVSSIAHSNAEQQLTRSQNPSLQEIPPPPVSDHQMLPPPPGALPQWSPAPSEMTIKKLAQLYSDASVPLKVDLQAPSEARDGATERTQQPSAQLYRHHQEVPGAHSQATGRASMAHSNAGESTELTSTRLQHPCPQEIPLVLVRDPQMLSPLQDAPTDILGQLVELYTGTTLEELAQVHAGKTLEEIDQLYKQAISNLQAESPTLFQQLTQTQSETQIQNIQNPLGVKTMGNSFPRATPDSGTLMNQTQTRILSHADTSSHTNAVLAARPQSRILLPPGPEPHSMYGQAPVLKPVTFPGHILKPVNAPGNVINPVNSLDNIFNPINTPDSVHNPVNSPASVFNSVNSPGHVFNSVNSPGHVLNPVSSSGDVFNLVNSPGDVLNPVNFPGYVLNSVNSQANESNPVNSLDNLLNQLHLPDNVLKPVNSPDNVINPVNSLSNVFNSVNSPANVFDLINSQANVFNPVNSPGHGLNPVNSPANVFNPTNSPGHILNSVSAQANLPNPVNSLDNIFNQLNSKDNVFNQSNSQDNVPFNLLNFQDNVFNPVNSPANVFNPVNAQGHVFNPLNSQANLLGPVNSQGNVFNPINSPDNIFNPVNSPANVFNPVNSSANLIDLVNVMANVSESVNSRANVFIPVNFQGHMFNPVNSQGNLLDPVNSQGNVFNPINSPDDIFNPVSSPANEIKLMNSSANLIDLVNSKPNVSESVNSPANAFNPVNSPDNVVNPVNSPDTAFNPVNSPANPFSPADSPTNSFTPADSPGHGFSPAYSPGHIFSPVDSPAHVLKPASSPDRILNPVSPEAHIRKAANSPVRVLNPEISLSLVVSSVDTPIHVSRTVDPQAPVLSTLDPPAHVPSTLDATTRALGSVSTSAHARNPVSSSAHLLSQINTPNVIPSTCHLSNQAAGQAKGLSTLQEQTEGHPLRPRATYPVQACMQNYGSNLHESQVRSQSTRMHVPQQNVHASSTYEYNRPSSSAPAGILGQGATTEVYSHLRGMPSMPSACSNSHRDNHKFLMQSYAANYIGPSPIRPSGNFSIGQTRQYNHPSGSGYPIGVSGGLSHVPRLPDASQVSQRPTAVVPRVSPSAMHAQGPGHHIPSFNINPNAPGSNPVHAQRYNHALREVPIRYIAPGVNGRQLYQMLQSSPPRFQREPIYLSRQGVIPPHHPHWGPTPQFPHGAPHLQLPHGGPPPQLPNYYLRRQ